MKLKDLITELQRYQEITSPEWDVMIETPIGWEDIVQVFVIDQGEIGIEIEGFNFNSGIK